MGNNVLKVGILVILYFFLFALGIATLAIPGYFIYSFRIPNIQPIEVTQI